MDMRLKIEHLCCGYGKKIIVNDFSSSVESGEILCILGPNGVGKTTLFKTILGHLPRSAGEVYIDNRSFFEMKQKERAQQISYVPQAHHVPFAFTVLDVVTMGRIAHADWFSSPGKKDEEVAWDALERLEISHLGNRIFTEISGGERQMVLIARALAQQSHFLMMDEPTSNLDFGNQAKVLAAVRKLADQGMGIIMTTHDPDHVFLCNANVILMMRGGEILTGTADEIVTPEHMLQAYSVPVLVEQININNKKTKVCQPVLY
jgi:iron complex transport system ATP-binding protein